MENRDAAKTVVDFYVLCARLKDLVRSGWKNWRVKRERVESVAEHIFGVQMLALAMWSQYARDVDIFRVVTMIAAHELEEVFLSDLTRWDIAADDKLTRGHRAVKKLLGDLLKGEELERLILEFDARETKDAKFAYYCDKLECDLQSRLYDLEGCVDWRTQDNPMFHDPYVRKLLEDKDSWSGMWLQFGRDKYDYDDDVKEVSTYAETTDIKNKT